MQGRLSIERMCKLARVGQASSSLPPHDSPASHGDREGSLRTT